MKKLKEELKKVSKSLATLSKQVDKMLKKVDSLSAVKATPKKKKRAPAAKKIKAAKKAPAAKKAKTSKKASAKPVTVLDTVFNVVKRSRKAITTAKIKEKVNLAPRQLSNALYKLQQGNKIVAISRGLYKKK